MYWETNGNSNTSSENNSTVKQLIEVASDNYRHHLDYFIKHRDTTVKQLAALMAGELLLIRYSGEIKIPELFLVVILCFLGALAFVFALSGANSCNRSFSHALRYVALLNKSLWALMPSGKITLPNNYNKLLKAPMQNDDTIQIPKHHLDSTTKGTETTEKFITNSTNHWKGFVDIFKICDLRIMLVRNRDEKDVLINNFKDEFKFKENAYAVLIVEVTKNKNNKWTIAGFNDKKEFETKLINVNDQLAKELKKNEHNRKEILKLALLYINRTPKEPKNTYFWAWFIIWVLGIMAIVISITGVVGIVFQVKNNKSIDTSVQPAIRKWEFGKEPTNETIINNIIHSSVPNPPNYRRRKLVP